MNHDPDILDEDATPEHELVVHRQDKLTRFSQSLRRTSSGDLTYLLGPPGTGKTMCAKLEVGEHSGINGPPPVYINCWQTYERNDILYQVADTVVDAPIHRSSTPRGEVIDHLTREPDGQRFVILDEADQIHDMAIIYDLVETPDLHLVLIANDEDDLFEGIDDRVRSRVSIGRRIDFEPYTARQLSAILAKRAEYGLQEPTAVDDRQLDTIAEHADGDARVGIRALREAVTLATEHSRNQIADADVKDGIPQAKQALRQKSIDQLNPHQRVVLDVIGDEGPIGPGAIYEEYCARTDSPRSDRRVRTYRSKLVHYNLVEKVGPKQDRTYRAIT